MPARAVRKNHIQAIRRRGRLIAMQFNMGRAACPRAVSNERCSLGLMRTAIRENREALAGE